MGLFILITALLAATAVTHVSAADCAEPCYCLGHAKVTMYCVNKGLIRPPEGYWPKVTYLLLSGNNITELDETSFAAFPNLAALSMSANQLTTFDVNAFASMPLEILDLGLNSISNIIAPEDVNLPRLKHFYINNNKLSDFDPDAFARAAPNLYILILSLNPMKAVSGKALLNHPQLQQLYLDGMDASEISADTFPALPNLQDLSLAGSKISDISGVFVNMNLESILLAYDNITHVTAGSFSSAHAMKYMYLYNSQLEKLDLEAVQEAVGPGSSLNFESTPLACSCDYEDVAKWAKETGVSITAWCGGSRCDFGL